MGTSASTSPFAIGGVGCYSDKSREAVSRLADHPLVTRVLELDPELILPFVVDRLGSGQQLAAERSCPLVDTDNGATVPANGTAASGAIGWCPSNWARCGTGSGITNGFGTSGWRV